MSESKVNENRAHSDLSSNFAMKLTKAEFSSFFAASANHHLTFSTPQQQQCGVFFYVQGKKRENFLAIERAIEREREEIRICICDGDSSNMCVGGGCEVAFLLKF